MESVVIAGIVSALATGLGVLPFVFLRKTSETWSGICSAAAGGMMIGASVFSLIHEAMDVCPAWETISGLVAGIIFLWLTARFLHDRIGPDDQANPKKLSRQSLLIVLTMFVHSAAEGIAIGVGFATGEYALGILIALVISVHNIPEGIAITLPLHSQGISLWRCAGYSIFSSLPQPLLAIPAFLLVNTFKDLIGVSLGFAAGAMLYLVAAELLPDSYERCTRHQTAWALMVGLLGMLVFVTIVGN